jgi:hypothetical protein
MGGVEVGDVMLILGGCNMALWETEKEMYMVANDGDFCATLVTIDNVFVISTNSIEAKSRSYLRYGALQGCDIINEDDIDNILDMLSYHEKLESEAKYVIKFLCYHYPELVSPQKGPGGSVSTLNKLIKEFKGEKDIDKKVKKVKDVEGVKSMSNVDRFKIFYTSPIKGLRFAYDKAIKIPQFTLEKLRQLYRILSGRKAITLLGGISGVGVLLAKREEIMSWLKLLFGQLEDGFFKRIVAKLFKILNSGVDIVNKIVAFFRLLVFKLIKTFTTLMSTGFDSLLRLIGFKVCKEEDILNHQ